MTAQKVMRKVERETPVYNNYESKKISVEFNINNVRNSVSGQFKIKRNKCIILSVRKLSIPVGRGLITSDSIVFVNFFDKSYLSGNFDEIKKLIGIDIDFNLLQALLTADLSKFLGNNGFDVDQNAVIDSQMYRLDSRIDPRISRLLNSANERRVNRIMKRMDNIEFSNLSFWIDPQNFVVRKISFSDNKQNENIVIQYNQYEQIGRSLFPQEVAFNYASSKHNASFLIKLSKSSVNSDNDFSFTIPEKFEKAKFNVAN